jgi:hypothetical protein
MLILTFSGYCHFLMMQNKDPDKHRDDMNQIKAGGNGCSDLLRSITSLSQKSYVFLRDCQCALEESLAKKSGSSTISL